MRVPEQDLLAPVRARGLRKVYDEVVAVDGIDLNVEPGDVYGFLGPNGAGKTTTLRMLLGLIRPTEGGGKLFGRDPLADGAWALPRPARRRARAAAARGGARPAGRGRWRCHPRERRKNNPRPPPKPHHP